MKLDQSPVTKGEVKSLIKQFATILGKDLGRADNDLLITISNCLRVFVFPFPEQPEAGEGNNTQVKAHLHTDHQDFQEVQNCEVCNPPDSEGDKGEKPELLFCPVCKESFPMGEDHKCSGRYNPSDPGEGGPSTGGEEISVLVDQCRRNWLEPAVGPAFANQDAWERSCKPLTDHIKQQEDRIGELEKKAGKYLGKYLRFKKENEEQAKEIAGLRGKLKGWEILSRVGTLEEIRKAADKPEWVKPEITKVELKNSPPGQGAPN